jgi:hypothetical protein
MDKDKFLARMDRSRSEFEAALRSLSLVQILQPGAGGGMTAKDILAHVTWFEREMVQVVGERRLVGSEWWNLSTDVRNDLILMANRGRMWEEVLAEAGEVYPRLRQALEGLEAEAYLDAAYFREMPLEWVPWQVIAGNTFEHYEHHLVDLQRALGKR